MPPAQIDARPQSNPSLADRAPAPTGLPGVARSSMLPAVEPPKTRLGVLLEDGARFVRRGPGPLLGAQLLAHVPLGALSLAVTLWAAGEAVEVLQREAPRAPALLLAGLLGVLLLQLVLRLLLWSYAQVVAGRAAREVGAGGALALGPLVRGTLSRLPRALLAGLPVTAAAAVPLALGAALVVAVIALVTVDPLRAMVVLLAGGVLILLSLLAATYVLLRYGLAVAAVAVEDLPPGAALRRSAALMQGQSGRAMALLTVLSVIALAAGGITSLFTPSPELTRLDLAEAIRIMPALFRGEIATQVISGLLAAVVDGYAALCWTRFFFAVRDEAAVVSASG